MDISNLLDVANLMQSDLGKHFISHFTSHFMKKGGTISDLLWLSNFLACREKSITNSSGGNWTGRAGNILTVTGATYKALGKTVVNGDRWLGNNGKYYSKNW